MNERLNENESGKASKVAGMKVDAKIGRFARFYRFRGGPTDQPTDRRTGMTSYSFAGTHMTNRDE